MKDKYTEAVKVKEEAFASDISAQGCAEAYARGREILEKELAHLRYQSQADMKLGAMTAGNLGNPGLPPVRGITDLINDSISGLRELNGRLGNTADHLIGSRPECPPQKQSEEGCLRERAETLLQLVSTAHRELGRLQNAL